MTEVKTQEGFDYHQIAKDILETIDREREQEIMSRRFGLYEPKQTLEQIGDLLGITRERVRQLEKAILKRLRESDSLPHQEEIKNVIGDQLKNTGSIATLDDLSELLEADEEQEKSHILFLSELVEDFAVVSENNQYHQAVALASVHDEKEVKESIKTLLDAIKDIGEPETAEVIGEKVDLNPEHTHALLTVSKKTSFLDNKWGLSKWPTVNPKNIRDKIYVVLQRSKKPMHFNDIAEAIRESDFKRKDVTTQAIHNELIKDKRFVLVGRGIYALKEWGYKPGTVADMIERILEEEGEPLHRDEIVKRVLEQRHVKETTILLNLQGKPQFRRVAKATYDLAE